jgi:SAM-dependent methyltransferase
MDLTKIAATIEPGPGDIWLSRARSSVSYPDHGNEVCFAVEDGSFWFAHRNRCIIETLKQYPPGGAFFDIGGGNGYVSLAIQTAGWPVVLIEPGPRGAANARGRGVENVICSTFEDAGILPETMPAAGAFDVVEHIADDAGFLRSVARALRPGGRLYLTVPAYPELWSGEDAAAGHCRRYTTATLRRVLEAAGLGVEYSTYFFRFLPAPIFLLRTVPWKLGFRRPQTDAVNRVSTDHWTGGGPLRRMADAVLRREIALIQSGRAMPFGGSCLAVAKKV